jgi:hypothetical protein
MLQQRSYDTAQSEQQGQQYFWTLPTYFEMEHY